MWLGSAQKVTLMHLSIGWKIQQQSSAAAMRHHFVLSEIACLHSRCCNIWFDCIVGSYVVHQKLICLLLMNAQMCSLSPQFSKAACGSQIAAPSNCRHFSLPCIKFLTANMLTIAVAVLQQSSTVRRIKDDATAASHTVDAVHGNLPSSSSAGPNQDPTASAMPAATSGTAAHSRAENSKASLAVRPKAAAVVVKPKGPQVVVKAKRKAEEGPPDAGGGKSAKTETNGQNGASSGAGLMGLAAYGSDSGSGSGNET